VKFNAQTRKGLSQGLRQQRKQQRTDRRHQTDTHRPVATRLDNLLHIGKGRLRHAEDPLGVG